MAQIITWNNVVHSHHIADHMNKVWGDYGMFVVPESGQVQFLHSGVDYQLKSEIDSYLRGYIAGFDANFNDVQGVLEIQDRLGKAYSELRSLALTLIAGREIFGVVSDADVDKLVKFMWGD